MVLETPTPSLQAAEPWRRPLDHHRLLILLSSLLVRHCSSRETMRTVFFSTLNRWADFAKI